jgi:2-C-methyl-D-erythritol 4-phosphate cytidylyltransferase
VPSSTDRMGAGVAAVVVAGGSGLRMGDAARGVRKQYATLDGEPVLGWSIRAFMEHPSVAQVVVVLPAEDLEQPPQWLEASGAALVAGGLRRSDSVRHGLGALHPAASVVLVHDGARPFVGAELIDRVVAAAAAGPVIPGIRATDTLKEVDPQGYITRTVDRDRIWHAQTPQAFPIRLLAEAHRRAAEEAWNVTDDAALCERMGERVRMVHGDPDNIKITVPRDLELARLIAAELRARARASSRSSSYHAK